MNRLLLSVLPIVAALAAVLPADAQVRLLRDLETTPRRGVFLEAIVAADQRAVFLRDSPGTGVEVWSCCEPDSGPGRLSDFRPGECLGALFHGFPGERQYAAGSLPGAVAFPAYTSGGVELGVTDGTVAGTRVIDLNPIGGAFPEWFVAVGDEVAFVARGPEGLGLWQSDGTAAGTEFLGGEHPSHLTAFGSQLLFSSHGDGAGTELWINDGLPGSSRRISDIAAGSAHSRPRDMLVVNGLALFSAEDGVTGRELYRTDGLSTSLLTDIVPGPEGSHPFPVGALGPLALLAAGRPLSPELWVSDGSDSGTRALAALDADHRSSAVVNDRLAFAADDSLTGREPWLTDGSSAGTQLLLDLRPGPEGSDPRDFVVHEGLLFFSADDGLIGRELWRSDGTAAGTEPLLDLNPTGSAEVSALTVVGDFLFFAADDGVEGLQLWRSDGTDSGTVRVTQGEGSDHSAPEGFVDLAGVTVFLGRTWREGHGLYRSDGTSAGTSRIDDGPRPGWEPPVVVGDLAYFAGDLGDGQGQELWATDGNPGGTRLVKDIAVDASSWPRELTLFESRLFFEAWTESSGFELWQSDGTSTGTERVRDINPVEGSFPDSLVVFDDRLFFTARDADGDRELWTSDGTEEGTERYRDLNPVGSAEPGGLTVAGDKLFFLADEGLGRNGLWQTRGQPGDIVFLGEISGPAVQLTAFGDRVFFAAVDPVGGEEPWASDGTAAGTRRLIDLFPGPAGSGVREAEAAGDRVFFSAYNEEYGAELWVTDGTRAGTTLVADLAPGPDGSNPEELTSVRGRLYFRADDGVNGLAVWLSDGTAEGTRMVWDPAGEDPCVPIEELTAVGESLYFQAGTPEHGREPWTARHFDIVVNADVEARTSALDAFRLPGLLGAPADNQSECGRTRLASGRRYHADPDELQAGVAVVDQDSELMLIEVAEWCGCSRDAAEPPPADPDELRDHVIVRRSADGLIVQRLNPGLGAPCP